MIRILSVIQSRIFKSVYCLWSQLHLNVCVYNSIAFFFMQSEVEEDILKTMQRLQDSINNLDETGTCKVDPECASSFKELVQVKKKKKD